MNVALPDRQCVVVAPFTEERWQTSDGVSMALRAVRPEDGEALRSFFNGLSSLSRYHRFFSGLPAIPEALLQRFANPDEAEHLGLVVTAGARIVGDGRLVRTDDGDAEIAAVVGDAWQGKGIGRRLFRALIKEGRARGWTSIRADYFSENRRIVAVLRDAGFALARDDGGAAFGRGRLAL